MNNPKTPFFRIREEALLYDIDLLRNALSAHWGNYCMGYSVKTNSLPWLLTYLGKNDFFMEVVSDTEYDLVCRLGFTDSQIIYNGPIKSQSVFERVLLAGGYINLDSSQEPDWLAVLSVKYPNRHFHVGVRVNCDIRALSPDEELVEDEGGRFGYCYETGALEQVITLINALPNVSVTGLHLHSSTQSRTVTVYAALAAMAVRIARQYQLELTYVDMGGGYFGGREDKPGYPDYFSVICRELKAFFDPAKTKLIVEPGVSLISRATTFETTVMDCKDIRGMHYLVTDGSRTNLNPLVTRHVYPHHLVKAKTSAARPMRSSQWVCGFTCMEYDRLFEIKEEEALLPGDQIIYDTAGGYTMCLNPLFIHYLPAVYVEPVQGALYQAREAWSNEEYLQKNYWNPLN